MILIHMIYCSKIIEGKFVFRLVWNVRINGPAPRVEKTASLYYPLIRTIQPNRNINFLFNL